MVPAKGARVLAEFYTAFGAICFTLLGLWLVVVQTRHSDWRSSAIARRRAYGVSLHFALPGLMSLLSLVDPDSTVLWRVSFAAVALGGAVSLIVLRGAAPTALGWVAYVTAIVLYGFVAVVAIAPGILDEYGISAQPVRVEAILQTLLVFLGANVAWLLLFLEDLPEDGHDLMSDESPGSVEP